MRFLIPVYTRSRVLRFSSTSILPSFYLNDYRYNAKAASSLKQFFQSVVYTKKSERSKRREGSGGKVISRGSSLFSVLRPFLSRKVSSLRSRKLIYRHQQYRHVGNEKRCDVFVL